MLDIKFIREHRAEVEEACARKGKEIDLDTLGELDDKRKALSQELDDVRTKQNKASKEIAQANESDRDSLIAHVANYKAEIKELERELAPIEEKLTAMVYAIPNIIDPSVPVGKDEDDNVVVKTWGEKPDFDFEVQDHVHIAERLDLIDTKKAAEVSGSRFAYLKGDLVRMQFALLQMTFDALTDRKVIQQIITDNDLALPDTPFVPIIPPVIIRDEVQKSIHRVFGDQTYQFDDGLNLVASAEHTLAPYHMNETLDESVLPIRYIGYSTAFRKEAGTYGKDMGGIFRTHQFDKIELETFSSEETGTEEQKLMVGIQEYLTQQLGLHYQLVHVCTGDMGGPDYNQFDIECWLPGQGKYRETHTSDYMTDYQTRGIRSRYKTPEGGKFLHTNDATAFAIGRTLIAVLENYQNADGSVTVPEALRVYMGGQERIEAK